MVSSAQDNNKRIAKNTLVLYFRMIFLMLVSLYTSRVVLNALGADDYGLYYAVGGVVLLLQFLNAALSNGTSRFITFELGKGDKGNTNLVFQNAFITHLVLAAVIVLIAETAGLWFVKNKLVIPEERLEAALICYHLSIFASFISITQVPYSALIISHEKMNIYAYVSILEGLLKLGVAYLIIVSSFDRLAFYALLILLVQLLSALMYRFYCIRSYKESSLSGLKFDKSLTKNVLSFSCWSLIGNAVHALNGQGMTIITNMFFGPHVVAARALSIRINSAVMGLVQNFRTAANPRIIMLYSGGSTKESEKLELSSTRYAFLLMLVVTAPIVSTSEQLLRIWLVEVPDYTTIFVQLILIQGLFFTVDTSLYTALYACGKIKLNALISPLLYLIQFIVVFIMFILGYSPITMSIAGVITSFVAGFILKPILLTYQAHYSYFDIYRTLFRCLVSALIVSPFMTVCAFRSSSGIFESIAVFAFVFAIGIISVLFVGLKKTERQAAWKFITNNLKQNK